LRIALLSDIHGNDIAFAAAEAHARDHGADQFVIAGDLLTDNPMTREVIERAKSLTQHIVYGNREQYLISHHDRRQSHWEDRIQFAPLRRTYDQLRDQDVQFIKSLPESIEIPLDETNRLFVIHQAPESVYAGKASGQHLVAVSRYLQKLPVQHAVYCCGHTHTAGVLKRGGQLFINAGSVGQKFYGGFQAAYVMLEWDRGLVSVDVHNVDYDKDAYLAMLEASGLLDDLSTKHWTQLMYKSIRDECNYTIGFFATAGEIKRKKGLTDPHVSDEVWLETVRVFIAKGILS
jgi:putative phosphoesterase